MNETEMEALKEKFDNFMDKKGLDSEEKETLVLSMFLEYREFNKESDEDFAEDDLDALDEDDEDFLDDEDVKEDLPEENEEKLYNKQMEEEYPNYDEEEEKPKVKNHAKGIASLIKKPNIIKKRVKPKKPPALNRS